VDLAQRGGRQRFRIHCQFEQPLLVQFRAQHRLQGGPCQWRAVVLQGAQRLDHFFRQIELFAVQGQQLADLHDAALQATEFLDQQSRLFGEQLSPSFLALVPESEQAFQGIGTQTGTHLHSGAGQPQPPR